jgi:hypothetical protein
MIKPQKEGEPILNEFIKLDPTDCPITYDCETIFDPRDPEGKGPAKVNSAAFKTGWEQVFGKEDDLAN